ncbi:MAG: ATP synthase F1 subunit delta [Proteobacteria bacterium]|nr:ATP synthase F1 subunit delta [Pseudomonadota bacterium]
MASLEIRRDEIAKRYGGVLFDLAQETKSLKSVLRDITRLEACLQNEPHAWAQVVSPILPLQTQTRIIESLTSSLKLGSLVQHFLIILCRNRRLQNLKLILEDFKIRIRDGEGIVEGVLETASQLSPKEMGDIQKSLKNQFDKEISLHQVVKENLIAGVVLRIGSMMIDASLRTRLNKLRCVMKG